MAAVTTLAEFARDPRKHIELVDGEIVASPLAGRLHFNIALHLATILEQHGLQAEMVANLILRDEDPLRPLVREPDVYVTRERADDLTLFQRAENMLLVVEVASPGSSITDWIEKMSEYADAGIPQYWIVEFFRDSSLHLYTFGLKSGAYGEREHWDKDVDIEVAGVRVQFNVNDLK